MEDKIKKMYFGDCALIIAFIIFLWVVLAYVMTVVSGLASSPSVRIVAIGSGCVVGVSATTALIAVLGHLKNNKKVLYTEDIMCGAHNESGS